MLCLGQYPVWVAIKPHATMDANIIKVYRFPSVIVFISRWIINGPQAPKFSTIWPTGKIMTMNWIALSISVQNEHVWCSSGESWTLTILPDTHEKKLFRVSYSDCNNTTCTSSQRSCQCDKTPPVMGHWGNCSTDFADMFGSCPLLLNCAERAIWCN